MGKITEKDTRIVLSDNFNLGLGTSKGYAV